MKPQLTVAFPCHNEETNIAGVLEQWARGLAVKTRSFELLVIDNHSTDRTCDRVRQVGRKDSRIRLVRNPRNLGYSGSCLQAFRHARGRSVLLVDGDGQYRVTDGLKVWQALRGGPALVLGRRAHRADPFPRKVTSALFRLSFYLLSGIPASDPNVGLRGWKRSAGRLKKYLRPGMPFANVQLLCAAKDQGVPWGEVEISHQSRGGGHSFYQYHRLPGIFLEFVNFMIRWKRVGLRCHA